MNRNRLEIIIDSIILAYNFPTFGNNDNNLPIFR